LDLSGGGSGGTKHTWRDSELGHQRYLLSFSAERRGWSWTDHKFKGDDTGKQQKEGRIGKKRKVSREDYVKGKAREEPEDW